MADELCLVLSKRKLHFYLESVNLSAKNLVKEAKILIQ